MAEAGAAQAPVLVVDDNLVTRRLLQLHLNALGYVSIAAEDGETALRIAERDRPAAVLLDIQLPGIDGLEVCRRLRAREQTSGIPVLLVTAMVDVGTRVAGFDAGADDYVTKPFEARELGARLRAHITLSEQRLRLAVMDGVCSTLRMLSHEFNNPLQAVVGGLHMAHSVAELEGPVGEGFRMAAEGATQLSQLAQQLYGLVHPVFKPTPIGPMLDVDASTQPSD